MAWSIDWLSIHYLTYPGCLNAKKVYQRIIMPQQPQQPIKPFSMNHSCIGTYHHHHSPITLRFDRGTVTINSSRPDLRFSPDWFLASCQPQLTDRWRTPLRRQLGWVFLWVMAKSAFFGLRVLRGILLKDAKEAKWFISPENWLKFLLPESLT